jgi:serine/threonine protein kinase/tetratricopeptide (TPR) repeat protein
MSAKPLDEEGLFHAARRITDANARALFLSQACGHDAALAERVRALLGMHAQESDAFPSPPNQTVNYEPVVERVGTRIGPYLLREQIGEGGFGLVFVAEQTEPVKRKVALKVIKPGMDTREVISRFEQERQALAMMDHPNIARVLDAGATDSGRPYVVMELVRGIPIIDYCDQNHLTPHERLGLFVTVCQAIQHAHQKGVIHRDVKPSNVLVTSHDGKPVAKVIDFGVAKAIHQQLTARTIYTNFAQMIGTPLYMSPEQAEMSGLDIDTRSDIYSLGVLLYELLTGTTPLEKKRFAKAAYDEIRRLIREEEPPKPSTRLSTSDSIASIAVQRHMEPAKLSKLVRGDLDCITMKCLEKDRTRRYDTASGLARDIQRYLADEVVEARPPSVGYRLKKFGRRHKGRVIAASLTLLALAGGFTYYFQQRAERERQRIEQTAAVERVVDHAVTLRDQALAHPEDVSRWQVALAAVEQTQVGDDATARERLQNLRTEIQAGLDAAERDRGLLDRLVEIRSTKSDDNEGPITDAAYAEAFREAGIDVATLAPAEAAAKIKARPPSVVPGLTAALDDWAAMRRARGRNPERAALLSRVAQLADRDPWRNDLRTALDQADQAARLKALQTLAKTAKFDELGSVSLHSLGAALNADGDSALAESVLRKAAQRHPGDLWVNSELGHVLGNLGRLDEAIRFLTAARAIRPETAQPLARALAERGDFDEAIAVFCGLVALRPQRIQHLGSLRLILEERGQSLKDVAAVVDQAVAPLHEAVRLKPDDAEAHVILGRTLFVQGKLDEAIAEIRAVKRIEPNRQMDWVSLTERWGPRFRGPLVPMPGKAYPVSWTYAPATKTPDEALSEVGVLHGKALADQGKSDEAIALYQESIRLTPNHGTAYSALGDALKAQGKLSDAVVAYKETIRLKTEYDAKAYSAVVNALKAHGKLDEAVAAEREAIRLKPDDAVAYFHLGGILQVQDDFAGALALYREGHERGGKQPDWKFPSAQWIAGAEWESANAERLRVVLKGEAPPKDNNERLSLARTCEDRKWLAAAARLTAEALETDPKLGDNVQRRTRHQATGRAVLAGVGQGEDDPRPDEAARKRWRSQALDWFRVDLQLYANKLEAGKPNDRSAIVKNLEHWKVCPDLGSVRDTEAREKLPEAERKEWQALWEEVESLLRRAREGENGDGKQ